MTDPRQIAASIVGPVDWQTDVSGFCRCPGEALHTSRTGKKDCRVSVDGAPTIFCFHASCAPAVAAANKRLRQELGVRSWEIALPGGKVLRSGDILQKDGTVLPRETIEQKSEARSQKSGERLVLETVRVMAERFAPEMFERFHWPFAEIVADSPLQVSERDAEDQFRTWLKLWPAHCHVWIGEVFSSGKGDSTAKNAIDRMSGAGAWARDPDSIVVLTPHEEENCFTVTSILRNLPQLPEFVVEWSYPLMRVANDLNPDALHRPQAKNKLCSDKEFADLAVGHQGRTFTKVIKEAESQLTMSRRTTMRYLNCLTEAGIVTNSGGLYWAANREEGQ